MANRVSVAPQMLRWARGRSGRSTEELEQRFPKLSEWEAGEGQPTSRQPQDYAQATYTPVGFLFLVQPPEEQLPIAYFPALNLRAHADSRSSGHDPRLQTAARPAPGVRRGERQWPSAARR